MKKALLQLHTAVFLAGFTAILGKLILLNEGLLVWYRMLITFIIVLVILYFKKQLHRVSFFNVLKILGVGGVVGLHWLAFYGSVKYANVSVALVCFSAMGFFTAVFEPLILRRRVSMAELLLGLLTIAGIYIIFDFHPQYKVGIAFGILSALAGALFSIFNKQIIAHFTSQTVMLYEMAGGVLTLSILLPLYLHYFPASYYLPTPADWAWLIILALFCTVISFNLQLQALQKVSAFTVNLSYNMEPVYGIILAFIFYNEYKALNFYFYIGVALILLAVVLQTIRVYAQNKAQNEGQGKGLLTK